MLGIAVIGIVVDDDDAAAMVVAVVVVRFVALFVLPDELVLDVVVNELVDSVLILSSRCFSIRETNSNKSSSSTSLS